MQQQSSFPELTVLSDHKKQLISLRLNIQKLSYQLQAQKQINHQLSSANSSLQEKLSESHKKCISLQQRLNSMSQHYEVQIQELKILIQTRSQQLHEVSRQILPKMDEDMIRIRLINQLQIPHRQEIEDMNKLIVRLQSQLLETQKESEILQVKLQFVEKTKQQQLLGMKRQHTDSLIVYRTQIQTVTQQNVREADHIKKLRKQIEDLKTRQVTLNQNHMLEIQQLHKQNNKVLMNYGSDHEVRNLKFSLDQKAREIREEKQQIQRLRRALDSKKEEYLRLEYEYNAIKEENQGLKEVNDNYHKINMQLKMDVDTTQSYQTEIRSLKREVGLKYQENTILLQKIKILEEDRGRNMKEGKQQDNKSTQILKLRQHVYQLENRLQNKEVELQQWMRLTKTNKTNQKERSPDHMLRQKLKEANHKIVDLLKQKVLLKRQIAQLLKG